MARIRFVINGVRQAFPLDLSRVPAVGETVQWQTDPPALLQGRVGLVTKVTWILALNQSEEYEALVHLKPATSWAL